MLCAGGALGQDMDEAYRLYERGEFEKAAQIVEPLVDRGSANASDMAFLGTCYLNMGAVETADEVIRAAALLDPDAYPVILARGNLALARERYEEAEMHFNDALERFPDRREAKHGVALAASGHASDLMETGEHERALEALRRAIDAQPRDERLLATLIALLRRLGRTEELLEAYDRYLELDPENAEALAGRGVLLHDTGRTRQALPDLHKAADLDTADPEAYSILAERSMEQGDIEHARTMLHEAVAKAVQLYSMYRMQAAKAVRDSDESAEQADVRLTRLKELARSAERPRQLLREALEMLPHAYDDPDLYLSDLRRLSEWYPSAVEIRAALADELTRRDRIADARAIWRELTEHSAFYYPGHLGAGRSYERESDHGRALLSYRRALDLAPDEPAVYRHLHRLYRKRGDMQGYLELLEQQMLKEPYIPLLFDQAAEAARGVGDDAAADRYSRRAGELRESSKQR
jgi:tetratricopeptide (TPR) repeat protein